ncbi:serine-rich adhesin for platelets-like [Hetaerina americana]|uniref:serine-rich adhesin for platelets-like n=1 Tax=Hetaerina americana TaxID=62018 RepID=UPI003A7F5297
MGYYETGLNAETGSRKDRRQEGTPNKEEYHDGERGEIQRHSSSDRIPTHFSKSGGPLGLPPRLVFTFGAIETREANRQDETTRTPKKLTGEEKSRKVEEKKPKKDMGEKITLENKNDQPQDVAVQTEIGMDGIKSKKRRITELGIRIADSSEEVTEGAGNVAWISEKDSKGEVHHSSCKTWSVSDRGTSENESLPPGEEDGKARRFTWLRKNPTRGSGMRTTAESKSVKFKDDQAARKYKAHPKDTDAGARKSKWTVLPHGSYAPLKFADELKRKIEWGGVIEELKLRNKDSKEAQNESRKEYEESEKYVAEDSEEEFEEIGKLSREAEGRYPTQTNDKADEEEAQSPENEKGNTEMVYKTSDEGDAIFHTAVNKELKKKCSDMGLSRWGENEDYLNGKMETNDESMKKNRGSEGVDHVSRETSLKPDIPRAPIKEELDKKGTRRKKMIRKSSQIINKPRQFSEEVVHSNIQIARDLKEEKSKDKEKGLTNEDWKSEHRSRTKSYADEIEEEDPYNVKEQNVMALYEVEYFWKTKKVSETDGSLNLGEKFQIPTHTKAEDAQDCDKSTDEINKIHVNTPEEEHYYFEQSHNTKYLANTRRMSNDSLLSTMNETSDSERSLNYRKIRKKHQKSSIGNGNPETRSRVMNNDEDNEKNGNIGNESESAFTEDSENKYGGRVNQGLRFFELSGNTKQTRKFPFYISPGFTTVNLHRERGIRNKLQISECKSQKTQQHATSNNKSTNDYSGPITGEKSLGAPETKNRSQRQQNKMQFSQDEGISYHGWENDTTEGAVHKKNIPRNLNKKVKPEDELLLPGTVEENEFPKVYSEETGTNTEGGIGSTDISREHTTASRVLGLPNYSVSTRVGNRDETPKVTGKPPICGTAPKKRREFGNLIGRPNGSHDYAATEIERQEWRESNAFEREHENVGRDSSMGEVKETTNEEDSSGSTVVISHSLLRDAGATGNITESSTSTTESVQEEYQTPRSTTKNKPTYNHMSGIIQDASHRNVDQVWPFATESQRTSDGDPLAITIHIADAKKRVNSKLLRLTENMSKLSIMRENATILKPPKAESKTDVMGMKAKDSQERGNRDNSTKTSTDTAVRFLHEIKPQSCHQTEISNANSFHSDVSASESAREMKESRTTSGDISIRSEEFDRLQGQIEVLEEKFLKLLDYVERKEEECERDSKKEMESYWKEEKREEDRGERRSTKQEIKRYGAVNQRLCTECSLRSNGNTEAQSISKSMGNEKTSNLKSGTASQIEGETKFPEIKASSLTVNLDTKARSSTSSIWDKIRRKSSMLVSCARANTSDCSSEEGREDEEEQDCYGDLIIEETAKHHQVRAAPAGARIGSTGGKKMSRGRRSGKWETLADDRDD